MEIRKSIEEWIASKSEAKLCLHNGFAGFSFGCPSNPIFLDKDYAIKILEKIGYRYIGLNIESECLYGDAGLG